MDKFNDYMFDGSPNNYQPRRLRMTLDMAKETYENNVPSFYPSELIQDIKFEIIKKATEKKGGNKTKNNKNK